MRVSYRWLCELLPGLNLAPAEVAKRLTGAGLEVEAVLPFGAPDAVVVVRVAGIEPHPSRDKLRLVTVDHGSGTQRVVCGASNVPAPGGLVVLAPLGTHLPAAGLTLTPREIGGVLSEGMLCSEVELGLAETSDGIVILPEDAAQPGTRLVDAIPTARDTVFEIGVTPNRADALSHVGVARDLATLLGLELRLPAPPATSRLADAKLAELVRVDVRDAERCPHYGAAAVLDVQVAPSPLWLRWRLQALGIRPISNVVDLTNLILLELGHPMHAFDLDRVRGSRIEVRRAQPGEKFATLDGVARELDADDLVICDGEGPTALAGVMGGQDSEIRAETRRVLLECAYFLPGAVRRTSRRHALSTDSSYRFERGVDWGGVENALERAAALLVELTGGARVPEALHVRGAVPELPVITLRSQRLDSVLGVAVPFAEALGILKRLGFEVLEESGSGAGATARVRGTSYRPDVKREADLIEEVARIRGLDEIPTVLPAIPPMRPRVSGRLEREMRELAVQLGLSEALTYGFVSPKDLEAVGAPAPVVTIMNPLTEERSVMRTSLLPGLLEALRRARRRGERSVRLFSVGAVFLAPETTARTGISGAARPTSAGDLQVLPEERPSFAALLAGPRPAYLARPEVDVYDAKGLAFELVERLTLAAAEVRPAQRSTAEGASGPLHPRGAAELWVGDSRVGRFGPLHPEVIDALDLDGSALVVELDLRALESLPRKTPRYRAIPRLPAIVRDISLEVSEELLAGDLARELTQAAGPLCESIELLDVFTGGPVPAGLRSLTFRLTYRDPKAATAPDEARTLTDKEVDERHGLVRKAAEQLGARQRA
jgi:phenylalanyl-tRNA synthetase beta chain